MSLPPRATLSPPSLSSRRVCLSSDTLSLLLPKRIGIEGTREAAATRPSHRPMSPYLPVPHSSPHAWTPTLTFVRQAKALQASLMEIVDRVEIVKSEHEKLEGGNKFLQS